MEGKRGRLAKVGVFGIGLEAYWEQFDGARVSEILRAEVSDGAYRFSTPKSATCHRDSMGC